MSTARDFTETLEWVGELPPGDEVLILDALPTLEWIPVHPPALPSVAVALAELVGLDGLRAAAEATIPQLGALYAVELKTRDGWAGVVAIDRGQGLQVVASAGEEEVVS